MNSLRNFLKPGDAGGKKLRERRRSEFVSKNKNENENDSHESERVRRFSVPETVTTINEINNLDTIHEVIILILF